MSKEEFMRVYVLGTIFTLVSSVVLAQQSATPNPAPAARLFAGSAELRPADRPARTLQREPRISRRGCRRTRVGARARGRDVFRDRRRRDNRDRWHTSRREAYECGEPDRLGNRRRHAASPRPGRLGDGAGKDGALVHPDRRHARADVNPPAAPGGNDVDAVRLEERVRVTDAATRHDIQRRTRRTRRATWGPASRLRFASAFARSAPARPRRSSKSGVGSARRAGARGAEMAAGLEEIRL